MGIGVVGGDRGLGLVSGGIANEPFAHLEAERTLIWRLNVLLGRHVKAVIDASGVDRREVGYYATPSFIARFLTNKMLEINPDGRRVLDPCVGKEEMLADFYAAGTSIDSIDIIDYGGQRYSIFRQADFLELYAEAKQRCTPEQAIDLPYDYYIANPPYNCHEVDYITRQKDRLTRLFGEIGVLNMYSMFLAAMIDCAKPGALIGVIISDSFLTARLHEPLRRKMLRECTVHYLILCPTDLFADQQADVRTCLLILEKGRRSGVLAKTHGRPATTGGLEAILSDANFIEVPQGGLSLPSAQDFGEIVVDCPAPILELFLGDRLGERFPCITGISTGNDKVHLSPTPTEGFTVPFYKNPGRNRFYAPPNAYLRDDFLDVASHQPNFMVRNKHLLFKEGITCSSMGVAFAAAYLPPNATFGVNATIIPPAQDLWWLLAYLNSSLVTFLVRGVLIRSNMVTSGYVRRIPLVKLSGQAKMSLEKIAKEEYRRRAQTMSETSAKTIQQIDDVIYNEIGLEDAVRTHIVAFNGDLLRRT